MGSEVRRVWICSLSCKHTLFHHKFSPIPRWELSHYPRIRDTKLPQLLFISEFSSTIRKLWPFFPFFPPILCRCRCFLKSLVLKRKEHSTAPLSKELNFKIKSNHPSICNCLVIFVAEPLEKLTFGEGRQTGIALLLLLLKGLEMETLLHPSIIKLIWCQQILY